MGSEVVGFLIELVNSETDRNLFPAIFKVAQICRNIFTE